MNKTNILDVMVTNKQQSYKLQNLSDERLEGLTKIVYSRDVSLC